MTTVNPVGAYSLYYGAPQSMEIILTGESDGEGSIWIDFGLIKSAIFSTILPEGMAGKKVRVGDSVIWDGYAWYVIPSGDIDTWRPVTVAGTALTTADSLAIVAGNKIEIERNDDGAFVINAIAPDIPLATLTSNGDGALVSIPGLIKPVADKFEVEAGEVTKISTDLLVNGTEELILYGGNAGLTNS